MAEKTARVKLNLNMQAVRVVQGALTELTIGSVVTIVAATLELVSVFHAKRVVDSVATGQVVLAQTRRYDFSKSRPD